MTEIPSWQQEYKLYCESLEKVPKVWYDSEKSIHTKDKVYQRKKKHHKDTKRHFRDVKRKRCWIDYRWCDYQGHVSFKYLRSQKIYNKEEYFDEGQWYGYQDCHWTSIHESMYGDGYEGDIEDYNWYCRELGYDHLATDFDWKEYCSHNIVVTNHLLSTLHSLQILNYMCLANV